MLENFLQIKTACDLREPMRIKGMLTFFQKYTKTPSDRIMKKGSLLLTMYFPHYSTQWILTPCKYKENVLPQILFLTILFSRTSKSLSMGVFVDGSKVSILIIK